MRNMLRILFVFVIIIVVYFSSVADAALEEGLIGYWPFDEGTGDTAVDASGNGRNLTRTGAAGWASAADAKIGNSSFHNSSGDAGDFHTTDVDFINGLDAFSLSIWVKYFWPGATTASSDRGFINGRTPNDKDDFFGFRYDKDGYQGGESNLIQAGFTTTGGTHSLESSGGLQSLDWQHLVFTWRSGEPMKFYVNGVLDTPSFISPTVSGTISDVTQLFIGKGAKDTGNKGWRSSIDDVRLYNRPLTQAEITLLASGAIVDPYSVDLEGVTPLTFNTPDLNQDVTYTIRITNSGTENDTFDLTVSGDVTANLSQNLITLAAGASSELTLTLPGSELTQPGQYEVTVTATSQADNLVVKSITTTTNILDVYDVGLAGVGSLTTEAFESGAKIEYTFMVTNIGISMDTIMLAVSGDMSGNLSQSSTTLASLASTKVKLTIPESELVNPGTYEVTVTAISQGNSAKTASVTTTTTVKEIVRPAPDATVVLDLQNGELTAGGYAIVGHVGSLADAMQTSALPVLPNNVPFVKLNGMPDLEDFLYRGGTIDVYVGISSGTPDVIINEVMWATDENNVGTVASIRHQWIELYNNSSSNVNLDKITLRFKPGSPAPSSGDLNGKKFTDRLSNVVKFKLGSNAVSGWTLGNNHGQNGNTSESNPKEFISMYRKSDKRGNNDGINKENWLMSTEISHKNHKGTPGTENTRTGIEVETLRTPSAFTPSADRVIMNEVYNDENNDYDWIELRALKDTNLENWTLSYTKTDFTEVEILRFPKRTIKAGEVWLFVNKDPTETGLAAGQNFTYSSEIYRGEGGSHKYLVMTGSNKVEIPDYNDGNFYLILRTAEGWERYGSRSRMHDVVGTARFARKTLHTNNPAYEPHTGNPGEIWETDIWPLNGHRTDKPDDTYLQTDRKFSVGKVWQRSGTGQGWQRYGGYHAGFKGGIGYDRSVKGAGTPGYHNDIIHGKNSNLRGGQLVISELMLTQRGHSPQWIEIHNTSNTDAIDLYKDIDGDGGRQGWTLEIENADTGSWKSRLRPLNIVVKFRDLGIQYISPNQTILITSYKIGRSRHSGHFPDHRVISIWDHAKKAFGIEKRTDMFLNAEGGFYIRLVDGSGTVADKVGNLDGIRPSPRDKYVPEVPYSWHWPTDMINKQRTSLIRIYDDGVPRPGTPDRDVEGSMRGAPAPLGTQVGDSAAIRYSWVHAVDTKVRRVQETWYGSMNDYGTPGYTKGSQLPVALAAFHPILENDKVVIRWITESELDNAGFNILRSNSRYGEFKKVNSQLIQGAGTTGERNTYKWVDNTAKQHFVYYYQIEDVSFAGERKVLDTKRLKGLISAEDKMTTTWSDLKDRNK